MTPAALIQIVETTWVSAQPEKRISALRNLQSIVQPDLVELFHALIDAKIANIVDDSNSILLILVHGIHTDGAWHRRVQNAFVSFSNINVIETTYDCVNFIQMLSPFRYAPVKKVLREIREARRNDPKARLMIVAHSFGSYILSKILRNNNDLDFERILLYGSIIPRNFNWGMFARNMKPNSILNHIGTDDFYPVLATCFTFGYGASGHLGFKTAKVVDRFFKLGHSEFFTDEHIKSLWAPFIIDGIIKNSDWDINKPATNIVVLLLSNPWFGRFIFFGGCVLFFVYLLFF